MNKNRGYAGIILFSVISIVIAIGVGVMRTTAPKEEEKSKTGQVSEEVITTLKNGCVVSKVTILRNFPDSSITFLVTDCQAVHINWQCGRSRCNNVSANASEGALVW